MNIEPGYHGPNSSRQYGEPKPIAKQPSVTVWHILMLAAAVSVCVVSIAAYML